MPNCQAERQNTDCDAVTCNAEMVSYIRFPGHFKLRENENVAKWRQ